MESILANTFLFVIIYLPIIAAVLNIFLLQHINNEKQETILAAKEVLADLRNLSQKSNRQHKQVMAAIDDLRDEMHDNHEAFMNLFIDSKSNHTVMSSLVS